MSYFRKTKEKAKDVLDAVLDDRIIRSIEEWQTEEEEAQEEALSYQEHLDLQSLEAEKKRLAAFLAKRYESTARPDESQSGDSQDGAGGQVADSRVARTLGSYQSGIEMYFEEADLGSPSFIFGHMEQMTDLGYLVEDTEEEAEAQGWATGEMPADFPTIKSFLEYQHMLCHQWLYHLSVCENCFDGQRSEPLFPPIDTGEVIDKAGVHSAGNQSFEGRGFGSGGFGGGQDASREVQFAESGIFQGDGFGGALIGGDVSEEEYRRLIQPDKEEVGKRIEVESAGIGPQALKYADLTGLPDLIEEILTDSLSPVFHILEEVAEAGEESYYIRLRLRRQSRDLASFVSSKEDIGPTGLEKVAEQIGSPLADHIADHVRPTLDARAGLQTVIIEVETEERITHVVLESGPGS